ncbi:alpha/beta hydrolase [Paludibaculum fermentans]|uniref:alpha/beta hydrolase n=1 Tax=Paludibaculum fermentans TaxID=1473598 RepID=UPI003EB8A0D7
MLPDSKPQRRLSAAVVPIRDTDRTWGGGRSAAWPHNPGRDDQWLVENLWGTRGGSRRELAFVQPAEEVEGLAPAHTDPAKTIVLIHGLWLAPPCWASWRSYYEARGYQVLTPAWPRMEGRLEEIRRDPARLAGLGLREITDHYDRLIRALPAPPILMGHCLGGLVVQMLLDRGLGAAGVAIHSALPKGVVGLPLGILSSVWPALSRSFHANHTVMLPFNVFRSIFANTLSDGEAIKVYQKNIVPGPCRPLYQSLFSALTSHSDATVNFGNAERAPLLLVAGGADQFAPAELSRQNYERYGRSPAVTAFQEFSGRSHLVLVQPGWQVVAGYALSWAQENARRDGLTELARGEGIA